MINSLDSFNPCETNPGASNPSAFRAKVASSNMVFIEVKIYIIIGPNQRRKLGIGLCDVIA